MDRSGENDDGREIACAAFLYGIVKGNEVDRDDVAMATTTVRI